MSPRPIAVVVTGSECTGKTTLAAWLAQTFGAALSPEYARQYVDEKRTPLTAADVEPIARGQMAGEDAASRSSRGVVIKDTDLLSTVVYSRHYYGHCPAWIEQAALERRGDVYLLLHPDVPWMPDGLQRDRPAARAVIHELFRAALSEAGAAVVDVEGAWEMRYARAEATVRALTQCPSSCRPSPVP